MSFFGTSFTFNGVSSEEFELALYDIGSTEQGETEFSSKVEVLEDRVYRRLKPLHYGVVNQEPLTFTLVCCATEERAAKQEPFDRWDLQRVSGWLLGHQQYKWLTIEQPDMETIRYRCLISNLKTVEIFHDKWGYQFDVTCDSPYGYMIPETFATTVNGSGNFSIFSKSSVNDYYYPNIQITGATSISIKNTSDGNRVFSISTIPVGDTVTINNENCVITSSSGANLYQYCNFNFFRLVRGTNNLEITGSGTYSFECEFPVNIGG